jgi:hypothetical protein
MDFPTSLRIPFPNAHRRGLLPIFSETGTGGETARHRYWLTLALTLVGLVFAIVAPEANWARAAAVGLLGVTLVAVLRTSGCGAGLIRAASCGVALAIAAVSAVAAVDGLPDGVAVVVTSLFAASTTLALIAGVARLVRARGVTLQVILGGLAIYLLLGGFLGFSPT